MARSCDCSGTCSCAIIAGENITITGTGSLTSPYTIEALASPTLIETADTASVNLEVSGTGVEGDPYVLEATATVALQGLTDVDPAGLAVGDVPTWNGTEFVMSAPSVPPGAVTSGAGLAGDGSVGNPLRVRTSGTWGTPPLDTGSQDAGLLTYLDSTGALRAQIPDAVPWSSLTGVPADRTRKTTISTAAPSGGADGEVWLQYEA